MALNNGYLQAKTDKESDEIYTPANAFTNSIFTRPKAFSIYQRL